MDGKNDYFIVKGFSSGERITLTIFDRRGLMVYKNENYDNRWSGLDQTGNQLDDDTYYYIITSASSITLKGYVMIRK
jgi:gliding motility-associated-like protein